MTLIDLAVQAGLLAASGFVGGASALLLRRPRTRPVTPQVPKRTGGAGTAPTRTQPLPMADSTEHIPAVRVDRGRAQLGAMAQRAGGRRAA